MRLAALCLLGALLAVLLRRGGGELALLLVLAVCGVAVALLLEPLPGVSCRSSCFSRC